MVAYSNVTCQAGDVSFTFKCDSTSLDFIGTLTSRRGPSPTEKLTAPSDVGAWFAQAGIVDDALIFSEDDYARALELREAVWAVVASRLESHPLPAEALAIVNAVAAGPDPVPYLDESGRHVSATVDQALSSIARDAIAIASGQGAGVIKECSRDGCNQIYVDRSRGARREWCAMDPCGNREKAREYRARKAAA